jgi:serine/threonine protein kinase
MALLDELLSKLAHGGLHLGDARAQLEAHALREPAEIGALTVRIRSEIAAGRLPQETGMALLTVVADVERTALLGKTQAHVQATLVRSSSDSDETAVRSADSVPAATDAVTQMRSVTTPADATQRRLADGATLQHDTLKHDPDATVRTLRDDPGTAARTLKSPGSGDAAYAATLKNVPSTPTGTLVMENRLVRSLAEADEGHYGPLEPGTVIKKRFVLETVLGKGGMGLVFGAIDRRKEEARDPNPRVALKVLNADFKAHPQSFMALQREARKAQTLAHPNVVTVFDFDRDGEVVYMTMELLKGRSLESIVREGRGKGTNAETALPMIRGIAEGLAYAHRKGIVHSDLKPGNIFITEDGTPKILDFGIARAVPSSVTEENKDVFDAGSLGAYTEAYATSEMVAGIDPHPADDMYALGVIAYELVTGFHPYQRHGAPNARQLGIKPAPIKGLKRKQARAIESCLSFDRKHRPQDAAEFLKAFRGVTMLQKVTLAAAAVLALTAGYLWYQNYLETSPAIPFSELPAATQQEFREQMAQGNEAWTFYERDHIGDALPSAISFYAEAYNLHPRNREAVAALNRSADALLQSAGDDIEKRREFAQKLRDMSVHFGKYAPVVEAAKE